MKAVGRNGESVLHFCCAEGTGTPRVVQVLIEHGANATARFKAGRMPVGYCEKDKKKNSNNKRERMNQTTLQRRKRAEKRPRNKDAKEEAKGKEREKEMGDEKDGSSAGGEWITVGQRKKSTQRGETRKTQQQKPRQVATTAFCDDDDDENDDDDDDRTTKKEKETADSKTDGKHGLEELTKQQLQERVRKLEEEVKSFNSRHTKARKLKTKMSIWEKSLASTPQSEGLEITVSYVMEKHLRV